MAYVNVVEWRAEQVAEWLQGLDDSIYPYAHSFLNNNVTGRGLLNITVDDLYKLQVEKVGHQEIIIEALEHLRNLHHNLDTENLQYVSLRMACKARSLTNEIRLYGPDPNSKEEQSVDTGTASAVADVMDTLWTLICWLDRLPFKKNPALQDYKKSMVNIGIDLGQVGFRSKTWVDTSKPITFIQDCCEKLAQLADILIRDVDDPLILQPATLDIATVKRKPNDDTMDFGIGFDSRPLNGTHVIRDVRFQSPAHQCARIHPGDEVVQINYQTVVGWTLKKIMQLMDENPSELIVTLKKRPRHLSMFGQIYMKPFRIPARTGKAKGFTSAFNNLPSPRAELLVAPNIRQFAKSPSKLSEGPSNVADAGPVSSSAVGGAIGGGSGSGSSLTAAETASDSESDVNDCDDDDDAFLGCHDDVAAAVSLSPGNKSPTQSVRSLLSRPRSTPMRRATISGSSPSLSRPYINISEIWSCQARNIHSMDHSSGGGGGRSSGGTSNTSTLQSNDSGHATLASPVNHTDVLRSKSSGAPLQLTRPFTVHSVDQHTHHPPTITTTDFSSESQPTLQADGLYCSMTGPSSKAASSRLTPPFDSSEYVNMEPSSATSSSQEPTSSTSQPCSQKTPMPKPRTQMSTTSLAGSQEKPSPNRKKPIPQPRTGPAVPPNKPKHNSPQKATLKSLKNLLPDKPTVQPVPTAEFQSFRRVRDHPTSPIQAAPETPPVKSKPKVEPKSVLPEYVNTTPPAVPARNATAGPKPANPSRAGSRSELLQQSKQPSSRRFSGAGLPQEGASVPTAQRRPLLGKIPRGSSADGMSSVQSSSGGSFDGGAVSPTRGPPPPLPTSSPPMQSMTSPYLVTDIVRQVRPPPPPPPSSSGVSLPPVFTPQTYNLREMHQQRSSVQGIRRQMATNPSTDASLTDQTEDTQ